MLRLLCIILAPSERQENIVSVLSTEMQLVSYISEELLTQYIA